MSATPPGWYPDTESPGNQRYWDGDQWTEQRAPGVVAGPPPIAYPAPGYSFDVYAEGGDPRQMLDPGQIEQFKRHGLTSFPTWLAIVLHFLTLGLFTMIYQGLKFSKLPRVKQDDFEAGKAIGFLFIPFFNWYWIFRYLLGLTDRLNFQFKLRGQAPPISRGLALTTAIVGVIPYVNLLGWLFVMPFLLAQFQSATNQLALENEQAYQQIGAGYAAG
jgi:hypothetical protein